MAAEQLLVAPAALNDLKAIYQYGLVNWGQAQSARYLDIIRAQFWVLYNEDFEAISNATAATQVVIQRAARQAPASPSSG